MNSHQIVDLIVLAALLYCAVKGASRGLLSQLAWVVALLLCFKFSGTLAPAIEPMIPADPPLKQWIAMLAVYVGLCGVSFFAAGMLSTWMEKAKIKDFDRHLGGVLGVAKGVIVCMSVMYFAITMSPSMSQIVSRTYSGYAAAVILHNSQYLISLVPEHRVNDVRKVIDRFNQHLQPGGDDLNGATPAGPDGFNDDALSGDTSIDDFDLSELFLPDSSGTKTSRPSLPNRSGTEAEPTIQELLTLIPSEFRRELSQKAINALRNSSPEEKRRLAEQLTGTAPESAGSILSGFLRSVTDSSGQGSGNSQSSPPPAQLSRAEALLLDEIAGIYDEHTDIVPRARQFLAGVPASVQRRVLDDWHADAMGLRSDPDPATDVNTPLDERILRQLQKSGITLDRLDRDLRSRLSQAIP
jgi:membrane protein required for colicin V production